MLNTGYRISGRYEIVKLIGEGGMANVYLAIDIFLKRHCAVKVLRGDLSNDEKFVMRFQREAISASSLSHPNIVELYDVGEDKGKYYIVMEYIEGKTLRKVIKERKALSVYEVVDIAKQLSSALSHAHQKEVVHRDIKPHNIIIGTDGKAKIMDYGIAMISNYTMLTNTNSIIGSVHYLSPEQVSGKKATTKSDLYSLGIVLYEMLTGEVPFSGDTPVNVALEHLNNKVPSVMERNRNVPQALENVIIKATAKSPLNRYKDAEQLYNDLDTALNPERASESKFEESENTIELEKTKVIVSDNFSKYNQKNRNFKKPRKMRRSNSALYGMLFVLAILISLIIFISIIIPKITTSKDIVVPDVIGDNRANAVLELRDIGFLIDPELIQVYSEEYEEGEVVKTIPVAGDVKKEGSYVQLVISKGLEAFKLDKYTGKDINIVKKELDELGLLYEIEVDKVDISSELKEGFVSQQFPKDGTMVKKGDTIYLMIPEIETVYEEMRGIYDKVMVDQFCTDYKLQCKDKYEYSDTIPEGYVTRQSRAEGTRVVQNARLTIYYSKGPDPDANNGDEPNN